MTERRAMTVGISLRQKAMDLDKLWSPLDVARVNDQVVRLVKIQGEFHWHKHTNEDELFYVLKGDMVIQLEDQPDVALGEGEMAIAPKGTEHCPKSEGASYILLFEPYALDTEGD